MSELPAQSSDTLPQSAPPKNNNQSPKILKTNFGNGGRLLIILAMSFIVLFALKEARSIILPVIMASFLAIISYSLTDVLRRYLRFPHWLAVTATVIIDFAVIFGVVNLINFLASDLIQTLQGDIRIKFAEKFDEFMAFLGNYNLEAQARALFKSPHEIFDTGQLVTITQTLMGQALSFLSVTTLVLILMTFFLGEAPLFRRNLEKISNNSAGKSQFFKALIGIQRYLFIKTVSSLCTGLLAWWLCAALNIPFSFLWGVTAYVLNYIPTFGSIVAAIPPVILAMLLGTWGDTIFVAAGYLAINFAIGNITEPLFLGKQFGIATSVVLLSVLLWGWVFGPVGMLLAVPISVLIKLALENSKDLSWVATLIADESQNEGALDFSDQTLPQINFQQKQQ